MQSVLSVNLILHKENQGWIIEKIARKLQEHAPAGISLTVSNEQKPNVDVNHWMSYAFANERQRTTSSMFITHIDDPYKLALLRREFDLGIDLGICMSSDSVAALVDKGIPRDRLCFVMPAHDGLVTPRKIRIGIATRVYPDGRKRENFLSRLARDMSLEPFHFEIFGAGWGNIVPVLQSAGATVAYHPGTDDYRKDYSDILEEFGRLDYYLYIGMDEGSLGTLDALAAGIGTIVTAQGFHIDISDGITHPFVTYEEMRAIFAQLSSNRAKRLSLAASLTWDRYARQHATIWTALHAGRLQEIPGLLRQGHHRETSVSTNKDRLAFALRAFSPRRVLSAMSHWTLFKGLRARLRR